MRVRWALFCGGLVVLIAAWPLAAKLELDRHLESMFRPDDPTLIDYLSLRSAFGGNAVVILVYRDNAFEPDGLDRNRRLSEQVRSLPGVTGILSPSVLNDAIVKIRPLAFGTTSPLTQANDALVQQFDHIFAGYTHTANHQYSSIVALLGPDQRETLTALRMIRTKLRDGGTDAVLVGEPVLLDDGFTLIERDGERLAVWTVALLSIVLLVTLHDWRYVLLSALSILWSVVVTRAVSQGFGIQLSIVSSILTAIVTVITVASVMHLGVRCRVAMQRGATRARATRSALASLAVPIFWTCATDAAGFIALVSSRIRPVQDFGVMIAIASIAVFLSILLFAPALMAIGSKSGQRGRSFNRFSRFLRRASIHLAATFIHHRRFVSLSSVIGILVLIGGVTLLETETSFLNNFRPDSEISRAYGLVERHMGGAGVWDIVLNVPVNITASDLERVRSLEDDLRKIRIDEISLTQVLSIADVEQVLNTVPLLSLLDTNARLNGIRLAMPSISDALLTPTGSALPRRLRIMLRSAEQLSADAKTRLIEDVRATVQKHVSQPDANLDRSVYVTGYYVLIAGWIRQLVDDQWRSFFVSSVLVWGLLAYAFRSARFAAASLLPNLLPAFLMLAVVGIMGDRVNMGAAMIAAVSVGLSIDSSVHFLTGYGQRRARGHGPSLAAAHAAGAISLPIMAATLALVLGFTVLATSDFVPTATFGLLIAATLCVGTLINLTLLPAMIRQVDNE
jgi:hypothetical protein